MQFLNKHLCIALVLFLTSTASHANGFDKVTASVKEFLNANGINSNTLNPDTAIARQVRNFLSDSCLYNESNDFSSTPLGSIGTISIEAVQLFADGTGIHKTGTFLTGDIAGSSTDDIQNIPFNWNIFQSNIDGSTQFTMNVNNFNIGSTIIYYGVDKFDIKNMDGKLTRYQPVSLASCNF